MFIYHQFLQTTAGTGFAAGESAIFTGGCGSGAVATISTIRGNGSITGVSDQYTY